MINFKKAFTPKDTEELKPNLFVKKTSKGYKQDNPLVWKGEWRLRGQIGWRNIFMIILIIFLYTQGSKYVVFYEDFNVDPGKYCENVAYVKLNEAINYEQDSSSLPSNIEKT